MNNVLDDNFLPPKRKNEEKLNSITARIRYVISIFIAVTEIKKYNVHLNTLSDTFQNNLFEAFFFYILGIIAIFLFISYNIYQANIEKNTSYYTSKLKRIVPILFVIYTIQLLFFYFRLSVNTITTATFSFNTISFGLAALLIAFILYREIVYLSRKRE